MHIIGFVEVVVITVFVYQKAPQGIFNFIKLQLLLFSQFLTSTCLICCSCAYAQFSRAAKYYYNCTHLQFCNFTLIYYIILL